MRYLSILLAVSLSSSAFAATPAAANNPHTGMGMPGMTAPSPGLTQEAIVVSTLDHPQYTYIEVSQGKTTRWLATTKVAVKKGDSIRFDNGMMMNNFYSKSLKRTFPSIAFVNRVVVSPRAGK